MRAHAAAPRAMRGFTLIEAMAGIALLVIVMSLAAPAFQKMLARQKLRTAVYDLVADLTLARAEALKRSANVTLKPQVGTDWKQGWQVQTPDPAGAATLVLGQRNGTGSTLDFTGSPDQVVFTSLGTVGSEVKISVKDVLSGNLRCVILDPTGRPKSLAQACPP